MKVKSVLFVFAVLLSACATTGRPANPAEYGFYTYCLPGIVQARNGDYVKAALFAGGSLARLGTASALGPEYGETVAGAIGTAGLAIWVAGGFEGYFTARERHADWTAAVGIFTPQERAAILRGDVFVGMSRGALLESLGAPLDINRTVAGDLVHEQYVYKARYVYVENDVVTAFQD